MQSTRARRHCAVAFLVEQNMGTRHNRCADACSRRTGADGRPRYAATRRVQQCVPSSVGRHPALWDQYFFKTPPENIICSIRSGPAAQHWCGQWTDARMRSPRQRRPRFACAQRFELWPGPQQLKYAYGVHWSGQNVPCTQADARLPTHRLTSVSFMAHLIITTLVPHQSIMCVELFVA